MRKDNIIINIPKKNDEIDSMNNPTLQPEEIYIMIVVQTRIQSIRVSDK